jgi:hypothetical protein
MNKSDIIDKIRKLFALGDRNRNPNEGEVKTALGMASKLMKQHNLSLSEIDLEKQKEDIASVPTPRTQSVAFWERHLATMIAKLFNCDELSGGSRYYGGIHWIFVGFKEEAELASQCYEYLNYTIRIMANLYAKHKLDFYAGITDRLQERINEEIKLRTPEETSKCTAIICCKDKLIESWKKRNLKIKIIKRKSPEIDEVSPDYYKGYLAGGSIDLQNKPKIK